MVRPPLVVSVSLVLVFLAACSANDELGAGEPEGISDKEYLRVTCSSLDRFSDVLIARSEPAEIQRAIDEYIAVLRVLVPPKDIAAFHRDYIAYLESASEKSLLLTQPPPLPPNEPRRRIAAREFSVPECKDATFFGDGLDE